MKSGNPKRSTQHGYSSGIGFLGAGFVFQFRADPNLQIVPQPRCKGCRSCPYRQRHDGLCTEHYRDQFAVLSWTRLRTGHSWRRNWTKCITVDDLWAIRAADRAMANHSRPLLGVKGLDHPQAKLSDEDVTRIRYRVAAGEERGDLAIEYGVSRGLVCGIANGTMRPDVPGPLSEFTSEDRGDVSKRAAAEMWERRHARDKERLEKRTAEIVRLRNEGLSYPKIAKILCISAPTVRLAYLASAEPNKIIQHEKAGRVIRGIPREEIAPMQM